ncbi:9,11-endoperoxide prostaglandin H2 reductase-like [Bicyclus anynana]|uniref:9,11-endoperoxide prostaglandin H2 reductase-like n=1 Tax=Bicyclus anynana TaxID=110368 RepID=A0ABM3M5I5_BICAN|nr:9,11-endoperoxide prostaglandin H2 reductase-like [Bicyclus anynana]
MASEINYSEMVFKLKNGYDMPAIGLGTRGMRNYQTLFRTIDYALQYGFRLFDTAEVYGNEKLLSNAFRLLLPKYGLDRDEIFITTKLAPIANDDRFVLETFERSLENLETEYIDLYMLQYPASANSDPTSPKNKQMRVSNWLAITKLYDQSKIRAIGVSNFNINHLMELTEVMAVGPVVNQIEWHPYYYKPEMLKYCTDNNILIQAYSSFGGLSLGNTELLKDPVVNEVAKRHDVPATKVLLLWSLQKGIAVIPKSNNPEHLKENMELNFKLTEEDILQLDALGEKNRKYAWDPSLVA